MSSFTDKVIRFSLTRRGIVYAAMAALALWGLYVAPFGWNFPGVERRPVPVDAIPDIGENQQIVFTDWEGRSPQDVEDQVSYPLSSALMGVPGVKTVRTLSMFGFSVVYVIFGDDVEFYWSRSRLLEKLASLPQGTLPPGVQPALGPDATALGQVFWYTLEARDEKGRPSGGFALHELRTLQDWFVRPALRAAEGVAEVASAGGYVQEYQVDADPALLRYYDVKLEDLANAVRRSNLDVGARSIEVNTVEYVIRGVGFVKSVEDIESAFVKLTGEVPVFVKNVARVSLGPAGRPGALDRNGAEVTGGVVVVRHGANPLAAIENLKKKIVEVSRGLPSRTLPDGTVSKVAIVPFYDRTGLIEETLGTLHAALTGEIIVTVIVILAMVLHFGGALIISGLLPLAVLMTFSAMKVFGVDANIVALSGIAIAIGTMVDMGIVVVENILRHLRDADPAEDRLEVVFRASREVGGAVVTAVATTIVGFLPVFAMTGPEGKLFTPLAFTKTFALTASVIVAVTMVPPIAYAVIAKERGKLRRRVSEGLIYLGIVLAFVVGWRAGLATAAIGAASLLFALLPERVRGRLSPLATWGAVALVTWFLALQWLPLGPEKGQGRNFLFAALLIGGMLFLFKAFQDWYRPVLGWCLAHKVLFLCVPGFMVLAGFTAWRGFDGMFSWLPQGVRDSAPASALAKAFPPLGTEFMPPLDEGAFLFMPSTMPHGSFGEGLDILARQDARIAAIPEVESAVGKLGRAESALDPAPATMIETVVTYRDEHLSDRDGTPIACRFDPQRLDFFRTADGLPVPAPDGKPYLVRGAFERDKEGRLIPDAGGKPFREWRPALDPSLNPGRAPWPGIRTPEDIWEAVAEAGNIPGTTRPPKLQPISARIVMLQSGIRASKGIRVTGPDVATIQEASLAIEGALREIPAVDPASVVADRLLGKPYIEIEVDRKAAGQYGVDVQQVQDVIETAIGGKRVTTTVEGQRRFPVRVRYLRELRDEPEALARIFVATSNGNQIPLAELAAIRYVRGPELIKGENAFPVGYVLFEGRPGLAEGSVMEEAIGKLDEAVKGGLLKLPAKVTWAPVGNWENQVRSERTLMVIVPLAILAILVILHLQFNTLWMTGLVFSGVFVAWAGGFLLIWLYAQGWFLDFSIFGTNMRDLFQVHPINMSVAVWVGFLALFGIASDDGVVMGTYLRDRFVEGAPESAEEVRHWTIEAAQKRVRPCLMTTGTTLLALLPVLTSSGRGSDIMIPMAIPSFGGMALQVVTMLIVPVLYCAVQERRLRARLEAAEDEALAREAGAASSLGSALTRNGRTHP